MEGLAMIRQFSNHAAWLTVLSWMLLASSSGCVTFTKHAIPANRLPHQFEAPSKCSLTPINFSMLAGNFPKQHLLDTGDVLAITIQGVLPPDAKAVLPVIASQTTLTREYYPPNGVIDAPSYGVPFHVQDDGTLQLPLIEPLSVRGLTLQQAAAKIRTAYVEEQIAKEGNDQVNLVLLRGRVNRVLVLREDASLEGANVIRKGETVLHKRGSADVIDLPSNESDVIHALATTGGLPGVDAYNEVWVLRKSSLQTMGRELIEQRLANGENPTDFIREVPGHVEAIRIPLKLCPGEPVPFAPQDVVLHDGDVVYIEPRRDEYFYTGGLLPGGQIPLPRDEDLDVLEAIALAQGSVGGLGGTSSVAVLRAGAGVGNIIPPTRVLILRKLPNGQQLPIRVDLTQAMKHSNERVRIMAGDYIMMYYKPSEMTSNALLNFFNVNWIINSN
jgi:hypothetical protein